MFNKHITPSEIIVDGTCIERVNSNVYLGKTITQNGDLLREMKRRITVGWVSFGKLNNIIMNKQVNPEINQRNQASNRVNFMYTSRNEMFHACRNTKSRIKSSKNEP